MDKLSRLSVLVGRLLSTTTGTEAGRLVAAARRGLAEIETAPDPFGTAPSLAAWLVIGLALPPVLGATWRDVLLGGVTAVATFSIALALAAGADADAAWGRLARRLAPWEFLLQAYVAALVGALCQAFWSHEINPAIVTLGAIAVPLPGYAVSVGVIDLAGDHIVGGLSHIIQGFVTLLLLVVGTSLGLATGYAIREPAPLASAPDYVPALWQLLWIPLLSAGLAVALQNSPTDLPWSVLCQCVTYAASYGMGAAVPGRPHIGYFFGGLALTVFSNVWGNVAGRSSLPLLIPSFVLSVSGSIGFRGLLNVGLGDTETGTEQLWRMFVVAGVTMAGIVAGCFLVKPSNRL